MFKIFEPNKIFLITSKAPKYVMALFILVLAIGLVEALSYARRKAITERQTPLGWGSFELFCS